MEKTTSGHQALIVKLYSEKNENNTWEEMYGFLSRTSGYLTRAVMRKRVTQDDFIKSLSWLLGLASKMEVDLEQAFLKKYPGICPYCLAKVCVCHKTQKSPARPIPAYKVQEELDASFSANSPYFNKSLSGLADHLNNIYQNNEIIWNFSGPWLACAKIFEEIAELHEAIEKYSNGKKTKKSVEEEFADVLAWSLSTWKGCFKEQDLDDAFIDYYLSGCPVCLSTPCECKKGSSRIQGLPDEQKFAELHTLFTEVESFAPEEKELIERVLISLKTAREEGDEPTATATVRDAKSTLERVIDLTEKAGRLTGGSERVISSIQKLLESF
jgi:hypothetical protein